MGQEQYVIDGFCFKNKQDATLAENEIKKIQQIEEKINYDNLDAVAMIYIKCIQNQIFQTVVGCSFLKKLQMHLQQNRYEKLDFEKNPIPGPITNRNVIGIENDEKIERGDAILKVRINHQKELKQKLKGAYLLNIILLALVGALFAIAMTGNNANILNYRYNIQNEYSQWEEELKEREAVVREKERELQISK